MKAIENRCQILDTIRGGTVLNMIAFHAIWDLVYIFGMKWGWYHGEGAYLWQQGICWSFIVLSGFCAGMSRHLLKRGMMVFGIGAGITLFTGLFMPEDLILFGVLTLLGSCMLFMAGVRKYFEKVPAMAGMIISFLLFGFTKHVDDRYLGFFRYKLITLPEGLYQNYFTAYFGFPQRGFYSTDYFSLLPWVFLFLTGFYIYRAYGEKILNIKWQGVKPLNFIGRHALEIYVVHQPVIYGVLWVIFSII